MRKERNAVFFLNMHIQTGVFFALSFFLLMLAHVGEALKTSRAGRAGARASRS